ncbi:UDP-N-acetylmuramoyl-L-alanyl-D-glutamate--2,6-diaminopimelate ligase [Salipaludibacillus aurantiacus]|uniref:UDP-N-acetylmuramoyl-L-alanyl-D-glutamate--2,6-diaminopimelate ligase n=1 Tax=Salipaludibacillus aurantiacus TaxID=1601833 RepID=A0A1H9QTY5_9BACI|nr:UDP-N-acetylmuramoyl-L-alanyl-D-glutamate--2,6-diaminopimelate ligase [Salipaludibacillus aurantiacus]SER63890.1 UDP-N-acetylmuramoyl-L-alanyl-D-glutamate--2,6-diaminopimelate ligase [Salipaludibacillus aurantiacus]
MFELKELAGCLPAYKFIGKSNPTINDLAMDNREVKKGDLFFCIEGFTVDGHDFAAKAVEAGAAAIVAERELPVNVPMIIVRDSKRAMAIMAAHFYRLPSSAMHMIGVTGTNGKTTTTHLIHRILSDYAMETSIIGTMYMKYKNKEIKVKNTTPDSLTLQKAFSDMATEGVEAVTMEVSSHALELGRVHGVDFNVGVFTNLTQDHLDYHKTMDNYARAKGLLFSQLGNGYKENHQNIAVLNIDDPYFDLIETMTAVPIITYGMDEKADFRATEVNIHESGTDFQLCMGNRIYPVQLKMTGRFSVYNALAAAAASYASGVPIQTIQESLAAIQGVAGRFEKVDTDASVHVIVDYAHTPDSLENVLETVREFAKGKVSVVVGCGGDRDRTKRPKMAAIAEKLSDYVYLTSDNPRSEDPEEILNEMKSGMAHNNYSMILSRKEAIFEAVKNAEEDEVILIAGKGHETYQIIGDQTFDFDDRLVAKEALKERY